MLIYWIHEQIASSYNMNPSTSGMIQKSKIKIMERGKSAVLMKSTMKVKVALLRWTLCNPTRTEYWNGYLGFILEAEGTAGRKLFPGDFDS